MTSSFEIRNLRGARNSVSLEHPVAVWDELDVSTGGCAIPTRVMILAGSECRFTCSMCDLWKNTIGRPTPRGAIPQQIQHGLHVSSELKPTWVKLYNGSNFFDERCVPFEDFPRIAQLVSSFDRVIVENHPSLTKSIIREFRDACSGQLEIAMGLETIHPTALKNLNKKMTTDDFANASEQLRTWNIDVRAFILLGVPGLSKEEAIGSAIESTGFAETCGVRHVSIVPLRAGNGYVESLPKEKQNCVPDAQHVELCAETVFSQFKTSDIIITIDLWDFSKLQGTCEICKQSRLRRLQAMNL
ncbi:MAG: radical SAM protein, partial [Pirellulales bacterium]